MSPAKVQKSEDVNPDGLHTVTVMARSFPFSVRVRHPYEEGKFMFNDRTGMRGDEIQVDDFDYERGVRLKAFLPDDTTMEEATSEGERDETFNAVDATDTELILWIKDGNPTAQNVIDASEGDAETAARLLAAENAATGNDPRKTVVAGLETVIRRADGGG